MLYFTVTHNLTETSASCCTVQFMIIPLRSKQFRGSIFTSHHMLKRIWRWCSIDPLNFKVLPQEWTGQVVRNTWTIDNRGHHSAGKIDCTPLYTHPLNSVSLLVYLHRSYFLKKVKTNFSEAIISEQKESWDKQGNEEIYSAICILVDGYWLVFTGQPFFFDIFVIMFNRINKDPPDFCTKLFFIEMKNDFFLLLVTRCRHTS